MKKSIEGFMKTKSVQESKHGVHTAPNFRTTHIHYRIEELP